MIQNTHSDMPTISNSAPSNTVNQTSNMKNNKTAMTEQQVLIAGGGHVGLSFALLLAHHGIASTLLEKNTLN